MRGMLDITDNIVAGKVVPPTDWCATMATTLSGRRRR